MQVGSRRWIRCAGTLLEHNSDDPGDGHHQLGDEVFDEAAGLGRKEHAPRRIHGHGRVTVARHSSWSVVQDARGSPTGITLLLAEKTSLVLNANLRYGRELVLPSNSRVSVSNHKRWPMSQLRFRRFNAMLILRALQEHCENTAPLSFSLEDGPSCWRMEVKERRRATRCSPRERLAVGSQRIAQRATALVRSIIALCQGLDSGNGQFNSPNFTRPRQFQCRHYRENFVCSI